jgi:hypothetical protein
MKTNPVADDDDNDETTTTMSICEYIFHFAVPDMSIPFYSKSSSTPNDFFCINSLATQNLMH